MMTTNTAVTTAMTPVSTGEMVARMMNAPMISTPQMIIHSGTWWAASQMSKRSFTTRLIMSPEFTRSKYVKQKRSYWSKRSWRMRDSMRAPMMWPCAETK